MSFINSIKSVIRFLFSCFRTEIKVCPSIATLSPNELLRARNALITGGTSGIGFEIARSFINAGACVLLTGRSQSRVDNAVKMLRKEFNNRECAFGLVMDITDSKNISDKFNEAVLMMTGSIDILVNNAGVNGCSLIEGDEETFDKVINTNLKGAFFLSKVASNYMISNNINGNILNIASSSSLRPAISAYGLSKWGILGLTQGLARLLAPKGITVNGIAPGPTATPMQGVENSGNISLASNLTGRFALPEEIGNMAVILVSDMGRMIVGDVVYMTGGSGLIYNGDIVYPYDQEHKL